MSANESCPRDEAAPSGRSPDETPAALPVEPGAVPVVNYAPGVPRAMTIRRKVAVGLGIAGLSVVVSGIAYVATRLTTARTTGMPAPANMSWAQQPPGLSPTTTQPAPEDSSEEP